MNLGFGVGLWQHRTGGGGPNPPSPIPGPLDFGSGDMDQTSYTTTFDVAAPHVVLGMTFYYTGSPEFTITHNGEPIEGRVQLNANRGSLLFIGDNLTIETGALEITCTGGTFGPFYGRVNEMPFRPNMATLQWITENFQANTRGFYHSGARIGRIYGIVASAWWTGAPTCNPLDVKVASRDFYGEGIGWTPGLDGFNWTWDAAAREATHTGPVVNASRASEFDAEAAGPYRFRCDISDYTDPPVTTSVQYRNAAGTSGANAPLQRFGNTLSGLWSGPDPYKRFELRMGGDVKVSNIRIYNTTVLAPAICGVIASADDQTSWFYSSPNNMPCAAISLKVEPMADNPPTNLIAPALNTDIAYVGTNLSVTTGTWSGVAPISYAYQWQDTNGAVFIDIAGETGPTYTANTGDIGYRVRCKITATDVNGVGTAFSNITYAVSAAVGPANTVAPFLQGVVQVGATIGCHTGTWTGSPTPTYTYQWRRNGANISGATAHVYEIVAADALTNISCVVTATNVVGAVNAVSDTQPVPAEVPVNVMPPLVQGAATVGQSVSSDYGDWTGAPAPDLFINWQVSDDGSTGWTDISGSTSTSLTVTGAYMGKYLRTLVTAVNAGGNTNAASNVAGPVV